MVLRLGNEYSELLGYGRREKWLRIADGMIIPVREDGVLEQYENMPEKEQQMAVTLMSYFPYSFKCEKNPDSFRKTCEYYISHGIEKFCNYPMLSGFIGVFPAWIGDRAYSRRLYELGNLDFFCEPFFASSEWRLKTEQERIDPEKELQTCFISGRGSLIAGLIMGLTKMCPWVGTVNGSIDDWFGEDIVLPEGWNKITVGRITIRGKNYRLTAENGAKRTTLTEL